MLKSRLLGVLLAPARLAYTLWVSMVFLAVGLSALLLLLALPRVTQRRSAARALARLFLSGAGMPLKICGAPLPPGQCVVVCNHASYLDGIVLTAALPPDFTFVIKREMAEVPLAGAALRRLGSQFVERSDRQRRAADARRVLRDATQGQSVMFFPEGTFTPLPGLLKFHLGAFVTAVRVGCPIVPAVLTGTRRALAPSGALPRPGRLTLRILPALAPPLESEPHGVTTLRDAARAAILAALGEPDLTCCDDTGRPPDTARAKSAPASRPSHSP
ncbi:MAG: 1-acyl-sn-glycerol-3-phosphate acyltransferase [Gammaproteobacteria bacterium]|nr:1-acyl-sn-glycerol-3-phosphate acyltransferase [Gammaproteobacteria bacterium]